MLRLRLVLIVLSSLLICDAAAQERRTSLVLGTEDWPPFSHEDKVSKQIAGLSTEVVNATLGLMGISVDENRVYPWARAQASVYDGKLDAVYTASINDERLKHCHFPSEPIITGTWVLFIKKSRQGDLRFAELSDLRKKRVGLILGYNYPSAFRDYVTEHSLIHEVPLETQNIAMLLAERHDYMPAVLETTLYLARTDPRLKEMGASDGLHHFPKPLGTTGFYLMFSKKTVKRSFVDKFSEALVEFKKTSDYREITRKYNLRSEESPGSVPKARPPPVSIGH